MHDNGLFYGDVCLLGRGLGRAAHTLGLSVPLLLLILLSNRHHRLLKVVGGGNLKPGQGKPQTLKTARNPRDS